MTEKIATWEIVELNGSGHRLWYVALLLRTAMRNELRVRLTIGSNTIALPEWVEHMKPVLESSERLEISTMTSRRAVLRRAMESDVNVAIPDADRWAGALLMSVFGSGKLKGHVLRMRSCAESGWQAYIKHCGKVMLWELVGILHRELKIHRLVPIVTSPSQDQLPDPVFFDPPTSSRDEWLRGNGLDPARKWIVVIGELSERKCIRELMEAILSDQLRESRWSLLAVGKISAGLASDLRMLAEQNPDLIAVREGFVPDQEFDTWIAHADAVSVLHRNEASSGVLLKSWAAGACVLAGGAESVLSAAQTLGVAGRRLAEVNAYTIAEALIGLEEARMGDSSTPCRSVIEERNLTFSQSMLENSLA